MRHRSPPASSGLVGTEWLLVLGSLSGGGFGAWDDRCPCWEAHLGRLIARRRGRPVRGESRITREDLEDELRTTVGLSGESVVERRSSVVAVVVVASVTLAAVAWYVGRSAGLRRSTVVEVRRI